MVSSRALTVAQYLAELPAERRDVLAAIRDVINRHLPPGYVERMNWGMISWEIPLSRYPDTYNGHPLAYMALAAQKHNFALYSMGVYGHSSLEAWLREEFRREGMKLDMGKSCIRFHTLEGMPLSIVAKLAASLSVEDYIDHYENSRHGTTKPATKPAVRKTARVEAPAAPAARPARKAAPAKRAVKRAPAKAKAAKRKPAARPTPRTAAARRPAKRAKSR